jgi:hypothetical protein
MEKVMVLTREDQGIQTSTLGKMALLPSLGLVQLLTLSLVTIEWANAFWQKVTDLYCVQHSLTDFSVSQTRHTSRTFLDQLKNRFKVIKKNMNEFKVHFSRHIIVTEAPLSVPQEEYIELACDWFQAVQKRNFRFKKCVPTLQEAVVCFSSEKETSTLHEEGLGADNFGPAVLNADNVVGTVVLGGQEVVVVTPQLTT